MKLQSYIKKSDIIFHLFEGEIHLLKSIIDGEFSLASFEDNYQEFLIGMGMPQIIAAMVSGSKEIVTFVEPRKGKQEWKKKVVTGYSNRSKKDILVIFNHANNFQTLVMMRHSLSWAQGSMKQRVVRKERQPLTQFVP